VFWCTWICFLLFPILYLCSKVGLKNIRGYQNAFIIINNINYVGADSGPSLDFTFSAPLERSDAKEEDIGTAEISMGNLVTGKCNNDVLRKSCMFFFFCSECGVLSFSFKALGQGKINCKFHSKLEIGRCCCL